MTEDHPPDRELQVRAVVTVTVEVTAGSVWSLGVEFGQVRRQAIVDVEGYLRENRQLNGRVKMVSEPKVRGVIMEES